MPTPKHSGIQPLLSGSRRDILLGTAIISALALGSESMAGPLKHGQHAAGDKTMSTITVKDGTEIFYKEWGAGQPIVFHHGWPLSGQP
jgi:non-heme chloroperoxidase